MKIAFVEWPEGLTAASLPTPAPAIAADILVTNELPFGPWLADGAVFNEDEARRSIQAHEDGLAALIALDVPAIISSRPVWHAGRLANEAFVLENGETRTLHRKRYFPAEDGWHETQWYLRDSSGFALSDVLRLKVGVLLCTEAMFNEHARAYGRQGADLIVIPRATGLGQDMWRTAGAMAAIVSGAYVVSSNRAGTSSHGTQFGGGGFAYAPGGHFLTATDAQHPVRLIDLDRAEVTAARQAYPCYVATR